MDEVDTLRVMDYIIDDVNEFIEWLQNHPSYWELYHEFLEMRDRQ